MCSEKLRYVLEEKLMYIKMYNSVFEQKSIQISTQPEVIKNAPPIEARSETFIETI